MADVYLDLIKKRRTYYSLENKSTIPDARILEIAREVISHTPSSFNCQSSRFVILLRDEHYKFWEIAKDCFKTLLSISEYKEYEKKLNGRQAGYGTILLYEDLEVLHSLQIRFPRFAGHVHQFSEHNSAMQAFNLWTALELEGLGCNLQHINPFTDQRVVSEWKVPSRWSLKAQLVFGKPTSDPNPDKSFKPTEDRIIVHGAE